MFPISDSIKSKKFPLVTLLLIAANIFFFLKEMASEDLDIFFASYALIPASVSFLDPITLLPFLTSMFLHGGFFHIISNMWFLWVFGDNAEGYFGSFWYLIIYLLSGIAGGAAQYLLNINSAIPMLGASGAVSGVLGAYYILYPHSRIKTLVPVFFYMTIAEIPAVVYLFYWFFVQLFQGAASLASVQTGGIAFWAHVAGFGVGVLFAKAFSKQEKGFVEGEIVG